MHACYHRERRRRRLFRFGERRTGGGGGSVSSPSAERVGGGQRGGDGDGDMLRFIIRRSVTTSPIIIVSKSLSLASRSFNLVSVATSPRISLAWCVVSVDGCQNLSARAIAAARRVSVFRRGWSSCCSSSDAPPVAPLPLACAVRTAGVVAGPTRATAAVAAPSTSGLRARTVVGGAELPPSASASVVEATGPVLSRLVVAWHARRHASARLARCAPLRPRAVSVHGPSSAAQSFHPRRGLGLGLGGRGDWSGPLAARRRVARPSARVGPTRPTRPAWSAPAARAGDGSAASPLATPMHRGEGGAEHVPDRVGVVCPVARGDVTRPHA